jgi:hypothetical protein
MAKALAPPIDGSLAITNLDTLRWYLQATSHQTFLTSRARWPDFCLVEWVSASIPTPDEFGKAHMVHAFVSSQVARFGAARFGVASFSVITHASLITFAVAVSGPRPSSLPDARTMPVEELRFVRTPELVHRVPWATKGTVADAVN